MAPTEQNLRDSMNDASLVERKIRVAVLFRNKDRRTTNLMNPLMGVIGAMPRPAHKSITFDRGVEGQN